MATLITAPASLKKLNGTVSITSDRKLIIWDTSPANAAAQIRISLADVTNFQQSPASSAKPSIKVVLQIPGKKEVDDYVFRLTSPSRAKDDKEALVSLLTEIITAQKAAASNAAQASSVSTPVATGATGAQEMKDTFADSIYLNDAQLQKSYLSSHPALQQMFMQSFEELTRDGRKVDVAVFRRQFWSSRVHLLRSHALEKKQEQASYNVLSTIILKKDKDDKITLNATAEQMALIFKLYPIVMRVYNELVPTRMNETQFWSKFFTSKLFKKLKGERITDEDANIPDLDKYLAEDVHGSQGAQFNIDKIPRFFDLDGNTQDHTETMGNTPDETMRPSRADKVPILRALNSLSEKLMANVAPSDAEDMHNPAGMDEKKFEELRLKDLRAQDADNRVHLNVPSQQSLFSQKNIDASQTPIADPEKLMSQLRSQVSGDINLAIELDTAAKSRSNAATQSILKTIRQRASKANPRQSQTNSLPSQFVASATMTHNTTIEFLHYFWDVFLSGDESRATELAGLAETLNKSHQRIDAVAKDAEAERERKIEELKKQQQEYEQATGKRRRLNLNQAGGGANVVNSMLTATDRAVKFAEQEYQKTYNEQMAQNVGT